MFVWLISLFMKVGYGLYCCTAIVCIDIFQTALDQFSFDKKSHKNTGVCT